MDARDGKLAQYGVRRGLSASDAKVHTGGLHPIMYSTA